MDAVYTVRDASAVFTPALLFYKQPIRRNIDLAVTMAGGADPLRPHVKLPMPREIARMTLDAGITKHKCASLAEAEMLAGCGVRDVLLAYNLVGPNCGRMARLARAYPDCRFSVLADHPDAARQLSDAMAAARQTV